MSINFSTLQGLTIPEGVVTQIADASGRVLWSAGPKIIYLRPSADISVDAAFILTPSDATAAYMLINEEVSDGEATTLGLSSDQGNGLAIFGLTGNVPTKIPRVTNIRLVVSLSTNEYADLTWTTFEPSLIFNDTTQYNFTYLGGDFDIDIDFAYEPYECSVVAEYDMITGKYIGSVTTEELVAKINEYILENAQLPDIKLRMQMHAVADENADGKSDGDGILWLSQAYVVIECE